jgi:hypothetical protein
MYFGGFLVRRPGSWSTWLAFRSLATAIGAMAAALILNSTALPKLDAEAAEAQSRQPQLIQKLIELRPAVVYIPVPALLAAIAAIVFRPLRPVLAPIAALASVMAILLVVGSLVAGLAPMYALPADLAG